MRLAIVAAGFTPEEADQLRRAMATFKLSGGVTRYRERLVEGMVRRGYERGLRRAGVPADRGLRRLRLPREPRRQLRPPGLRLGLGEVPPPGGLRLRPAEQPADGLLRPGADRPRRPRARRGRPAGRRERQRLGLHPGAAGRPAPAASPSGSGCGWWQVSPEAEARAILAARRARNGAPFASVEEAARRAGVGRQALEALAGADAFAGTGASRRRAGWDARGVANGPQDLPLFAVAAGTEAAAMAAQAPLVPEPAVTLPDQTEGEAVVEDYLATGLTLRRHPLALLRPALEALGCADTRQLNARRAGTKMRLPGLVLIRQRPGSAKGVVFLTVEDEHGVANLVVFERIAARDRAALVSGRAAGRRGPGGARGRAGRGADHPPHRRAADRPLRPAQPAGRDRRRPPRTRTGRRRRSAAPTRCGAPSPAASARSPSCRAAGTFADARLARAPRPVRSSPGSPPLARKEARSRHVQPLQHHQGPAGHPRAGPRHERPHRQHAAAARDLPGLCRADRPQPARGPRAGHGALGHAVAGLRAEGQEVRPGRHQRPQRQVAALAALARRRAPLRRALHQLLRERGRCPTARGRRSGSPSTRAGRWPSSPASGRAGPRCGRSRRARRPTTSSPF